MSSTPPRRTVQLPRSGMFKRAGKIRLGEKAKTASGTLFPKATDYFVVVADESGITSPAAAAAFHEVYGDKPKSLNVQLPGHTPEEVFEGAHRLYGTGKLKRKCDGETCDVRRATGGWDTQPCVCDAQSIPPMILKGGQLQRNGQHCTLSWTLQVILAEVAGIGVWTMTTTSVIASESITNALYLAYDLTGSLANLRATLFLRQADVAPDGKAKTVYVPDLRFEDYTPAQLMAGEGRAQIAAPQITLPALPPVEDDEEAELHADSDQPEQDTVIETAAQANGDESLLDAVKRQIASKELGPERQAFIVANYGSKVGPAAEAIVKKHREKARNMADLLDAVMDGTDTDDEDEHVSPDDVEVVA